MESRTLTWVTFPLTDCDFVHRMINRFWFDDGHADDHSDDPSSSMREFGDVFAALGHLKQKVNCLWAAGYLGVAHGMPAEPMTEERRIHAARIRAGLERMYPPHELASPSEFEKGLLLGELQALEWVMWSGGRGSIDV